MHHLGWLRRRRRTIRARLRPHRGSIARVFFLLCLFSGAVAAQSSSTDSAALRPGDLVRLRIWREPDLSGDYRIDEHGSAVFPKIGPLNVGYLAPDSLRALLVASYSVYLQTPSIEVRFLRRVNVLGEVRNPGLYDVDPTMSIADVVAMAGGVTSDGDRERVELIRDGHPMSAARSPQDAVTRVALHSGDQLRVRQRGWFSRNTAVIAAGITGVALLGAAVIRP